VNQKLISSFLFFLKPFACSFFFSPKGGSITLIFQARGRGSIRYNSLDIGKKSTHHFKGIGISLNCN